MSKRVHKEEYSLQRCDSTEAKHAALLRYCVRRWQCRGKALTKI